MKTFKVSVHLLSQSQPFEYDNVRNAYIKEDMYCLYLDSKAVHKFPVTGIFMIVEDYKSEQSKKPI